MTAEKLLEILVRNAETYNIKGNVDKQYIKKVMQENNLSLETLVGTLCCMVLKYNQELTTEKDKTAVYIQRLNAVQKTLEQLERSQNLSPYQVKNLKQKNGIPTAKKFNMNKFKMCMEIGANKKETMEAMDISEATYYRLLRAYRAEEVQNNQ